MYLADVEKQQLVRKKLAIFKKLPAFTTDFIVRTWDNWEEDVTL